MTDETSRRGGVFPIPDRRIEQGFYLVLFIWVGYLMTITMQLQFTSRLVPMIVGIPMLVLIGMQLAPVNWSRLLDRVIPLSGPESDDTESADFADRVSGGTRFGRAKQQHVATVMIGWIVALVVLLYFFGYYFVLPPYVFALSWYFYRDVRRATILAITFTIAATLLFIVLFDVALYTGALGLPNPIYLL